MMAAVPRDSAYDYGIYRKWHGHDGLANERRRRKQLGIPDLCARCARGIHAYRHDDRGCMQPVGKAPYDYVCRCRLGKSSGRAAILARLRALSKG